MTNVMKSFIPLLHDKSNTGMRFLCIIIIIISPYVQKANKRLNGHYKHLPLRLTTKTRINLSLLPLLSIQLLLLNITEGNAGKQVLKSFQQ